MPIASVEDLKVYLATDGGGATDDVEERLLAKLLAAADQRFSELTRDRTLAPVPALVADGGDPPAYADTAPPVTYSFPLDDCTVQVPDLREVVELRIDETPYTGRYVLRGPRDAPAWRITLPTSITQYGILGWDGCAQTLHVTGRWGPLEPDAAAVEAVCAWAARVYQERAARWSDARQDAEGGIASYFRGVPPNVKATIDSLRIPGL